MLDNAVFEPAVHAVESDSSPGVAAATLDRRALSRVFSLGRLIRHVDAVYRRVGLVAPRD